MVIFNLFLSFFKIGLFAVGGAYSFLPLIEKEAVEKYHWLTKEEFLNVLGLSQIFPGAISIKYATYTGYKIAGIWGAIVANIANFLAPASLIYLASLFYIRYKDLGVVKNSFNMIQLAVFAMVIGMAFQLIDTAQLIRPGNLLIITITIFLFCYMKVHPAIIIIGAGFLGAVLK